MPTSQPNARWKRIGARFFVGLILLVFVSPVVLRIVHPPQTNPYGLRGSIQIQAPPGADVYLGDRHVGQGNIFLTWDDLLAPVDGKTPGVRLSSAATTPYSKPHGGLVDPAFLSNRETLLWSQAGISGRSQSARHSFQFAWRTTLLRRPNGQLDPIIVLDVMLPRESKERQRFLIPFRIRQEPSKDQQYLFMASTGKISIVRSRGFILPGFNRPGIQLIVKITPSDPPEELATEIETGDFWNPSEK